jgi:hypothetical protein
MLSNHKVIHTFNILLNDEIAPQMPINEPKMSKSRLEKGMSGSGESNLINSISI